MLCDIPQASNPLHVLIAGAGVGGLALANQLQLSDAHVTYTVLERTNESRKFGGPIQLASNAMESLKNLDAELYGEIEARVIARHPSMTSSGSTLGPNYVLLTTQVEGALQEYRDTRLTRSAAVQVCLWYMVHAWYMHTVSHALGAPCRASSTLPLITPSSTTPCAGPLPLRERHPNPGLTPPPTPYQGLSRHRERHPNPGLTPPPTPHQGLSRFASDIIIRGFDTPCKLGFYDGKP